MTTFSQPAARPLLARVQLGSIMEHLCQAIEPTAAEYANAKEKYEAVARWLSAGEPALFEGVYVYPQGSFALETAIRPLRDGELDVDLIIRLVALGRDVPPRLVRDAIGARLRDNLIYKVMLKEKNRCWRLDYAGQFHLDLTGSILNPECRNGGELVPDKQLGCWKATNPQGYRNWFEAQAALSPLMVARKDFAEGVRAQIDALPAQVPLKGLLRRIVQLLKRHRDQYFDGAECAVAPISIVITTLAAHSYARVVTVGGVHETEFDFVRAVIAGLPRALRLTEVRGRRLFLLENPTTEGENFCEKWNADGALADAFFRWHQAVQGDLSRLLELAGMDQVRKELGYSFGEKAANAAVRPFTETVVESRRSGSLYVAPLSGVGVAAAPGAIRPLANTNYGR